MKKWNRTNIILFFSLALLAASSGLYAWLYLSFTGLEAEVNGLYGKTAEDKATFSELQRVEQNLKTTLGTEDRLTALFVPQESIVDFISLLESTMKHEGLSGSVDSVAEVGTPELNATGKEDLDVSLTASGDWNSILKFTGLLEKLPYKSTIDSVNMSYAKPSADAKTAPKGPWKEQVTLHVVVIKSEEGAAPAPEPAAPAADTTIDNQDQ